MTKKNLTNEARRKNQEYVARWQREHPEQRRAINRRYRERHRKEERARVKRWRERRKEQENG